MKKVSLLLLVILFAVFFQTTLTSCDDIIDENQNPETIPGYKEFYKNFLKYNPNGKFIFSDGWYSYNYKYILGTQDINPSYFTHNFFGELINCGSGIDFLTKRYELESNMVISKKYMFNTTPSEMSDLEKEISGIYFEKNVYSKEVYDSTNFYSYVKYYSTDPFPELKKELTVHTSGKPESDKFYIFLRGLIPLSKYMVVSKYESYVEENVCSKIEISSKYIKITEEKPINIYSLEVGTESRIYTFYYDDYYNCLQANMEYNINLTVDSDYIYSQYGHKRPYIKGVACYISLKRDLYRGINAPTNYEEPIIDELSKRLNLDVSHDRSFNELVYQNYISLEQARDK